MARAAAGGSVALVEDSRRSPSLEDEDIMPGFDDVPVAASADQRPPGPPGPASPGKRSCWRRPSIRLCRRSSITSSRTTSSTWSRKCPQGSSLWDAWDEPEADAAIRYGWLQQIAEGLHALHQAGAILEGVRPDLRHRDASGPGASSPTWPTCCRCRCPPDAPIRATLYTAPELILNPDQADARADLYSFGAMLYSLEYLHHALEEKDFERQFAPKQITDASPTCIRCSSG